MSTALLRLRSKVRFRGRKIDFTQIKRLQIESMVAWLQKSLAQFKIELRSNLTESSSASSSLSCESSSVSMQQSLTSIDSTSTLLESSFSFQGKLTTDHVKLRFSQERNKLFQSSHPQNQSSTNLINVKLCSSPFKVTFSRISAPIGSSLISIR